MARTQCLCLESFHAVATSTAEVPIAFSQQTWKTRIETNLAYRFLFSTLSVIIGSANKPPVPSNKVITCKSLFKCRSMSMTYAPKTEGNDKNLPLFVLAESITLVRRAAHIWPKRQSPIWPKDLYKQKLKIRLPSLTTRSAR